MAIGIIAGGLALGATDAWAETGLDFATDTTFALRAESSVVDVTSAITVTNVKPDQVSGTTTRRFYYDAITVPVPVEASAVAAESNGSALTVTAGDAGGKRSVPLRIDFSNLYYGQSRTVLLTYVLPGAAPRTKDDVQRINPAYASFVAYGVGDAGKVSVHVVVPSTFEVETFGATVTPHADGSSAVYEAIDIAAPDDWYLLVSARLDEALARSDVDVEDRQVSVRAWPNDPEWATWVNGQLTNGLPALQKLVDRPWPLTRRLEIVEAFTPYLRGYGGWFQPLDNRIEVGEDLDPRLLMHELSHTWFNKSFFVSRWIDEGMAEEYSSRTVASLGGPLDAPKAVDRNDKNAVALEHWTVPAKRDGAGDVEDFGYNASWWTIRQLTDEIGLARMASVIDAAFDHTVAYAGADPAEKSTSASDWRRFLDLVESVGGSTNAAGLFGDLVLDASERSSLAARTTARSAYDALVKAGAGWFAPAGVRDRMEQWDYPSATALMTKATEVLSARDVLNAEAAVAQLTVPEGAQAAYEKARTTDDLARVLADEQRRLEAVRAIVAGRATVAAPRDRDTRLGLWHRDPPEPALDAAVRAFAADDTATVIAESARAGGILREAAEVGRRRTLVATLGAGGLVVVLAALGTLPGIRRRRRRRRAAASAAGATAVPTAPMSGTPTGPVLVGVPGTPVPPSTWAAPPSHAPGPASPVALLPPPPAPPAPAPPPPVPPAPASAPPAPPAGR